MRKLNKLVKKKRRTRARRKRKELIQEILEARKGPRHINVRQKYTNKNKHEERIWRNHVRRRRNSKSSADFYKSLYTQTVLTPESAMKSSPDS